MLLYSSGVYSTLTKSSGTNKRLPFFNSSSPERLKLNSKDSICSKGTPSISGKYSFSSASPNSFTSSSNSNISTLATSNSSNSSSYFSNIATFVFNSSSNSLIRFSCFPLINDPSAFKSFNSFSKSLITFSCVPLYGSFVGTFVGSLDSISTLHF